MQKSGFLDQRQWAPGVQLSVLDLEAGTTTLAVDVPAKGPCRADVITLHPLVLRVEDKTWSLKAIPESEATMPIKTSMRVSRFVIEGEVAQEPEAS